MLFSVWKEDLKAVLDNTTAGPQILVGSSIGAWLALLVAKEREHRIHSLVGISSAPDLIQRKFISISEQAQSELESKGETVISSEWGDYVFTKKFLDEIDNFNIMDQEKIPLYFPVRLIHGMRDGLVPYQVPISLAEKIGSSDILVILRKKGGHRLSQPEDIAIIFEELDYLTQGSKEVKDLAITSWSSFSVYSRPDRVIQPQKG